MLSLSLALSLFLSTAAAAPTNQSPASTPTSTVICIAGQCLQGYTNTTLGAVLSATGGAANVLLLPGEYTSSTNPQFLHSLLTSSSASLSPSPGFDNGTRSVTLPLNVVLEPGLAIYPQSLYSGQGGFSSLPTTPSATNESTPLTAASVALGSNVWVSMAAGSQRVVVWDSVPDVSQLPAGLTGALALLDMQSTSCSSPCAGAGVCSASGTCTCPTGFNGTSCESCSKGFFGLTCSACPAGCTSCDDGIAGSGRCLVPTFKNAPATCNCLNGVCDGTGGCTCNAGWQKSTNGTACAQCSPGFFLTSAGNCEICSLGCTSCADGAGTCLSCASGFTLDANDQTQCVSVTQKTTAGIVCPDGSFSNGAACEPCSTLCSTCTGPTTNQCIICGNGLYSSGGSCVGTNGNGVCAGGKLIADNNKHQCDGCPAKCTACGIPNFNVASTIDQVQCSACVPGFVLSGGKCITACPAGTFLNPTDNMTCTTCDSSCGTCAGSSTFCISCANGLLADAGKCVSACPSTTFPSTGSCVSCHPDCATCSGTGFNQCKTCPVDRPVLSNGRCLPTCARNQFFDSSTGICQSCDTSCSSCAAAGPSQCLACSSSSQVLRAGTCVAATCTSSTSVVPGLGVCLSDLVSVTASRTSDQPPLPSVSGINAPTRQGTALAWWQILLMFLGCAFIFLVIVMCWRRRARKQRAKKTRGFAVRALSPSRSWRDRLFGLFTSRRPAPPIYLATSPPRTKMAELEDESDPIRLHRMEVVEQGRFDADVESLRAAGAYEAPHGFASGGATRVRARSVCSSSSFQSPGSLSQPSVYSTFTGEPHRMATPRIPVRTGDLLGRLTPSATGTSSLYPIDATRVPTPAEAYALDARANSLKPMMTGSSSGTQETNPFRKYRT